MTNNGQTAIGVN